MKVVITVRTAFNGYGLRGDMVTRMSDVDNKGSTFRGMRDTRVMNIRDGEDLTYVEREDK